MQLLLLKWNVHATVLAAILYLLPIADHLQSSSEQWNPVQNSRPVSSPSNGLWPDWWPVQPSQKEEDRKSSHGTEGQHFILFNLLQLSSNVWLFTGFLSRHQNSPDSWENDPGHRQVPSWSLTPQKLQVGRYNFYGCFYICKLLNINDLCTLAGNFFLLFLNKVSQVH